jgi:hypothetical protein
MSKDRKDWEWQEAKALTKRVRALMERMDSHAALDGIADRIAVEFDVQYDREEVLAIHDGGGVGGGKRR